MALFEHETRRIVELLEKLLEEEKKQTLLQYQILAVDKKILAAVGPGSAVSGIFVLGKPVNQ